MRKTKEIRFDDFPLGIPAPKEVTGMDSARKYRTNIIELKKIMVEQGLDRTSDLSDASGISRNILSKILSGKARPSTIIIEKLIFTLCIPMERVGEIFFKPV